VTAPVEGDWEMRYSVTSIILTILCVPTWGTETRLRSIRDINFRNFSYPWSGSTDVPAKWQWLAATPETKLNLVSGSAVVPYSEDHTPKKSEHEPSVNFKDAVFGDVDGDGGDEAAVTLHYSSGGTANWDYVYIYSLKKKRLKLLGLLETGSRGRGGLVKLRIQDGLLTFDFADPERAVGDCCSEGYARIHYRWNGSSFIQLGPTEHGELSPVTDNRKLGDMSNEVGRVKRDSKYL
jgi:hypothetical protein